MPELRNLIFIWDVIVVLWFYTHTVFTGVSSDDPGYDSSLVMMSTQDLTGHRCFPVSFWVTVEFFTPLFCVLNLGDTLSARCMQPLL